MKYARYMISILFLLMAVMLAANPNIPRDRSARFPEKKILLEQKKSPFSMVYVYERRGVRYLHIGKEVQSAWDPARPDRLVFDYSRLLAAALTAWPGIESGKPARVLIVGLGGGSLCRHIELRYPRFRVEVVELDPVVREFALKYFGVSRSISVHIGDGRDFLERNAGMYDIIVLDAYGEGYIPPGLATREFFTLVRSRLLPGGLAIANTWLETEWEKHEVRIYLAVFGPFCDLRYPKGDLNRVIVCGREPLPGMEIMKEKMRKACRERGLDELDYDYVIDSMGFVAECEGGEVITDSNAKRLLAPAE